MLNNKSVAVVVPAYNEETQIGTVIKTMPDFVDRIVIVNDHSKDKTLEIVKEYIKKDKNKPNLEFKTKKLKKNIYNKAEFVLKKINKQEQNLFILNEIIETKNSKIILINHLKNGSVGAAIASGYNWCKENNIYCTAVMAGDGQMDPKELKSICMPVINEEVDYVKGNRLKHRSSLFIIPKIRYFGNSVLSLLTKISTGYWRISDTQTGYTAISLTALKAIRIHNIYKSYGCPNDILLKLNIAFCTLKEIEIKPIYNVGEKSKMKIFKVIPKISWLLFKGFWKRLYIKYLFRDFHPLFLFYNMAFLIFILDIPFIWQVIKSISPDIKLPLQSLIIFIFLTISGFQSLFFAMWMDMIDNERLQK